MSIRDQIPNDIRRASKVIGLAAWLDDPVTWAGIVPVLSARLTLRERAALAVVAMASLPDEQLEEVMSACWRASARGAST
jgi:hypothetical protein